MAFAACLPKLGSGLAKLGRPMSRIILSASALILFAVGAASLFGADDLARSLLRSAPAGEPIIQVAAGGLLGFAILNWMSRGARVGGIYMRPLTIGNSLLFAVGGLSLAKALSSGRLPPPAIIPTAAFCGLALAFGWLAFGHDPIPENQSPTAT